MSDDSEMDGHDLAERRGEEADHPATGRSEAHKNGLMNSNIDYRSHGVPLETYAGNILRAVHVGRTSTSVSAAVVRTADF